MTRRAAPASVHGIICCRAFGDFSHNALSRFHLRLFQTQMSASRPAASSAANPSAARTPSARTAAWLPASRVSGPRPTDAATVSLMSRAPRTAKKYSPTIRVSSPPDVDECADGSACGRHAVCQNVAGTYVCVCDAGFTAAPDGNSCEGMWPCRPMRGGLALCDVRMRVCVPDEDECASMPGVCGSARCDNLEGSFMCECDTPGEHFHTATRRCVSPLPPGNRPRALIPHVLTVA